MNGARGSSNNPGPGLKPTKSEGQCLSNCPCEGEVGEVQTGVNPLGCMEGQPGCTGCVEGRCVRGQGMPGQCPRVEGLSNPRHSRHRQVTARPTNTGLSGVGSMSVNNNTSSCPGTACPRGSSCRNRLSSGAGPSVGQ